MLPENEGYLVQTAVRLFNARPNIELS